MTSCRNSGQFTTKESSKDTVIIRDTIYYDQSTGWKLDFKLTHDPNVDSIWLKPVSYYLNNPKCDPSAKDFYLGVFRPSDNYTTAHLLSLITTGDSTLRPFYRWILNKIIIIQDGALGEYTGIPARLYAEKFPNEFFQYLDVDTSGERYQMWTSAISYSGFKESEDFKNTKENRSNLIKEMTGNCINCPSDMKKRIKVFAKDCIK
jgi:hypothetical protein